MYIGSVTKVELQLYHFTMLYAAPSRLPSKKGDGSFGYHILFTREMTTFSNYKNDITRAK